MESPDSCGPKWANLVKPEILLIDKRASIYKDIVI